MNLQMIDVKVRENDQDDLEAGISYTANVKCPVCNAIISAYYLGKIDKRRSSSTVKRWYYPNFERHLIEKHNNLIDVRDLPEDPPEGEYSGASPKTQLPSNSHNSSSSKRIQPKIDNLFTRSKNVPSLALDRSPEKISDSESDSDAMPLRKKSRPITEHNPDDDNPSMVQGK